MSEGVAIRELVAQAVLARLRSALPDVTIQRNRRSLVDADEAPHLNFFDAGHTPDPNDFGEVSYSMSVPLDATIAAESDEELGPAVNSLYLRVVRALTIEPSFGGLVSQISEGAFDVRVAPVEESERPLAFFSLEFTAEFNAQDGDPSSQPA